LTFLTFGCPSHQVQCNVTFLHLRL